MRTSGPEDGIFKEIKGHWVRFWRPGVQILEARGQILEARRSEF